jgi:hypothetical protein
MPSAWVGNPGAGRRRPLTADVTDRQAAQLHDAA